MFNNTRHFILQLAAYQALVMQCCSAWDLKSEQLSLLTGGLSILVQQQTTKGATQRIPLSNGDVYQGRWSRIACVLRGSSRSSNASCCIWRKDCWYWRAFTGRIGWLWTTWRCGSFPYRKLTCTYSCSHSTSNLTSRNLKSLTHLLTTILPGL